MNKKLLTVLLGISLFPSFLFAQLYRMEVDAQDSGENKVIDRVFTGNTIGMQVSFFDAGSALTVTNWNMRFMYGYGQYDTNGMVSIAGMAGASNNIVLFQSTTNAFFSENENYYFSIVGTNATGQIKTFARGRMIEEYDPATGGIGGDPLPMPWGSYVLLTLGTASNQAYRGDWGVAASNKAASALQPADTNGWTVTSHSGLATGTPIYVETALSQGFTTTGAVADVVAEYVKTGHVGNVSIVGKTAFGSNLVSSGAYSLAEGYNNTAIGHAAHVEGAENLASGNWSHSEGWNTKATSTYSHSEGYMTTAGGIASWSGGAHSKAIHDFSYVWSATGINPDDAVSQGIQTYTVNAPGGIYLRGPLIITDTNLISLFSVSTSGVATIASLHVGTNSFDVDSSGNVTQSVANTAAFGALAAQSYGLGGTTISNWTDIATGNGFPLTSSVSAAWFDIADIGTARGTNAIFTNGTFGTMAATDANIAADLDVNGDSDVQDLVVNGNLTVVGVSSNVNWTYVDYRTNVYGGTQYIETVTYATNYVYNIVGTNIYTTNTITTYVNNGGTWDASNAAYVATPNLYDDNVSDTATASGTWDFTGATVAGVVTNETDPTAGQIATNVVGGWTFDGIHGASTSVWVDGVATFHAASNAWWKLIVPASQKMAGTNWSLVVPETVGWNDIVALGVQIYREDASEFAWPESAINTNAAPAVATNSLHLFYRAAGSTNWTVDP